MPSGVAERIGGVVLLSEVDDHGVLGDVLWRCVGLVIVGEVEGQGVRHVSVGALLGRQGIEGQCLWLSGEVGVLVD